MRSFLVVGIGSALGGMARYGAVLAIGRWLGETFPWGTLLVNISGSFVIGFFFTLTAASGWWASIPPDARIFVTVGICGGYTTFSSFSLQTLALLRDGEWLPASLNILGSVALCLLAAWVGFLLAATFNTTKA